MSLYHLTVFEKSGKTLLDETFEASNNNEAKEIGSKLLEENEYSGYTHRCVSPDGKLILFHR